MPTRQSVSGARECVRRRKTLPLILRVGRMTDPSLLRAALAAVRRSHGARPLLVLRRSS